MFTYSYYYDFYYLKDGEYSPDKLQFKKKNLFSIHQHRLRSYNSDWDLKKIALFELMLFSSKRFEHKPFTLKTEIIANHLRVAPNTAMKVVKILESEGIISVNRNKNKTGLRTLNYYEVNHNQIIESLEKIYNFGDISSTELENEKQFLKELYNFHFNTVPSYHS